MRAVLGLVLVWVLGFVLWGGVGAETDGGVRGICREKGGWERQEEEGLRRCERCSEHRGEGFECRIYRKS